jgi:glutamate 5-kinase
MRYTLRDAHRIVVKLGTQVVTTDGVELAVDRLMGVVSSLAALRKRGLEVLLVSSGAVGMGMRALGLRERPRSLGLRQACAAVGQGHLMHVYTGAFSERGVTAAQVLLTQEDLGDRDRALCLRTTLMRLLELGTIPILNENDSVSVRELVEHRRLAGAGAGAGAGEAPGGSPAAGANGEGGEGGETLGFGDNDGLSARVAVVLDADALILLTNVDGVYTANPSLDPTATRLPELPLVDDEAIGRAAGTSPGGTGGMLSKLEAARLATAEGTTVVIANGGEPGVVERILAGEDVGTLVPAAARRRRRWRHIAISGRKRGAIIVNDGALKALAERKASLLPVGVLGVEGEFEQGDLVEIRDGSGRVHGRGLVNYDADACRRLAGRRSDDIDAILGYRTYDALITRDNLVMGGL